MDLDEQAARRTLLVLDEEPETPSTVDVRRAVLDGRRRTRRRALVRAGALAMAVGLLAGAALGVVAHQSPPGGGAATVMPSLAPSVTPSASQAAQAPPAPASCAVQRLPAPPGHQGVIVMGGDPSGRYLVGRSFGTDGNYHPLLWTDGALLQLDTKGTDAEVDGISVNSSGVVAWSAGQSSGDGYVYRTYRYAAGKVTELAAAKGFRVLRVDGSGTVYGIDEASADGTGHVRLVTVPVTGSPGVRDLQRTDTQGTPSVYDVGGDGTAVGVAANPKDAPGSAPSVGVYWRPGGPLAPLPVPSGAANGTRPVAIAGSWIAGLTRPETDRTGGVRWNLDTGTVDLVEDVPTIEAINRYGWVVGEDARAQPVALLGDRLIRLPVPPGTVSGGAGAMAMTVSADGRVIGGQTSLPESVVAVRWTCQ